MLSMRIYGDRLRLDPIEQIWFKPLETLHQLKTWLHWEIRRKQLIKGVCEKFKVLLHQLCTITYKDIRCHKRFGIPWKKNYHENERIKKSSLSKCFSELANFKQKENKSIEAYYDTLNELIFKWNWYGVISITLEFNINFFLDSERNGENFVWW